MATSNAINANSTGLVRYNGTGTFDAVTTTNHAVLVGAASNGITSLSVGASSTVLVGSTGADPSFSATPTVTSITFGSGAALSIFEQGTFTATMRGSGTAGTFTYDANTQIGRYQKVGRIATVTFRADWSSAGTATGNLQCITLPYTSSSVTGNQQNGTWVPVGRAQATTADHSPCFAVAANGTTLAVNSFDEVGGGVANVAVTATGSVAWTLTYETT